MPLFSNTSRPLSLRRPAPFTTPRMIRRPWLPDPFEPASRPAPAPPPPLRRSAFDWSRTVAPAPRPFTYAGYAERVPPPAASTAPTPSPAPIEPTDSEPIEAPLRSRRPAPLLGA